MNPKTRRQRRQRRKWGTPVGRNDHDVMYFRQPRCTVLAHAFQRPQDGAPRMRWSVWGAH